MQIRPLTGTIGADILGADVRDPAQFPEIFQAFSDHGVIAIRDQDISPDDQVAFAERIARIQRRNVPDECFKDRGLLSKWIDHNR